MKAILGLLALFLSIEVFATTHPGVVPYLDFDENYVAPKQAINSYLVVVPEEWSFPDRTSLGRRQKEKFEKALAILEEVMNSDEFRTKVLSYRRSDGQRLFQKNYLWRNTQQTLSNEDVFDIIMTANEKMIPGTTGEMNIYSWVKVCSWYERPGTWCRKVIGSTSPYDSKWMKLNWKFYSDFEVSNMVSNIVHEWLHLLGFLHGNVNMREEVPYVVGSIAGQVAQNILDRE